MKVLLDGIVYSLQASGGVSVYFSELIRFLSRKEQLDLTVDLLDSCVGRGISDIESGGFSKRRRSRYMERYRGCPVAKNVDVFHSSYYRRPIDVNVPSVVTVHDFYYERFRRGLPRLVHSGQKFSAIKAAKAIICVSQATADDLHNFVGLRPGQSLHVIHNGVGSSFFQVSESLVNPLQLLYVGGRNDYKNFKLALDVLQQLPEYKLVCVGGGPLRKQEFDGFPQSVIRRVVHHPYLTDVELADQYRRSHCLLYLSSFEGFGIPVAEAMKCGCPVVGLQSCLAVQEVGGKALVGIECIDPFLLKNAIELLQDPVFRREIINFGIVQSGHLSWDVAHAQTFDVYGRVCES